MYACMYVCVVDVCLWVMWIICECMYVSMCILCVHVFWGHGHLYVCACIYMSLDHVGHVCVCVQVCLWVMMVVCVDAHASTHTTYAHMVDLMMTQA